MNQSARVHVASFLCTRKRARKPRTAQLKIDQLTEYLPST